MPSLPLVTRDCRALARALTRTFQPLRIDAFSLCCRPGCTGTYAEANDGFEYREAGIIAFSLYLGGMNYCDQVQQVGVHYSDFEYLMAHWHQECELIALWCDAVEIPRHACTFHPPRSEKESIVLQFNVDLRLVHPCDEEEL